MKPFAILKVNSFLLVSIQEEIDDSSLDRLLEELADRISALRVRGVILDLHQVDVMDSFMADSIRKVALMLRALEARAIVSGLRGSAVMTLVAFDIDMHDVEFSLDIEDAIIKLHGWLEGTARRSITGISPA
jgi:rsbT antagonist protein RsbS